MKRYYRRLICLSLALLFLFSGLIACSTIKAEHLRQQGFQNANLSKWTSDTDKALGYYLESLVLEPDNVEALRVIGRLYYLKGNYDKAEEYLQKAIAKNDKDGQNWNNLAWIYLNKEQYSKMLDAFEKAIKYRSGFDAWDQIGLGLAYYNMQQYDLAEEHFLKVLSIENKGKSHIYAKLRLGFVYYKKGNIKESERYFEDCINSYTDKHVTYQEIGRFYNNIGELDQAEKYLKKSIESDNKYAEGWNRLGWVYWKKEEYSKMRDAFEKAVQFRENKEATNDKIGLATAFYHMGDFNQAEELFKQVFSLVKNDSDRFDLSSFWIPLAVKRNDFELVKKLWNDRPLLGLHFNIEDKEGYIHFINKEQFGQLAGLRIGDRIIDINGNHITDNGSLKQIIKEFKYGQTIDISFIRGKDKLTQKVVLDYEYYLPKTAIAFKPPEKPPDTVSPKIEISEPEVKEQEIKVFNDKQLLTKVKIESVNQNVAEKPFVIAKELTPEKKNKPGIMTVDNYIAVFDFEVTTSDKGIARPLTESVRREVLLSGIYRVIDRSNMEKILGEHKLQLSGCVSGECIVETGQLLGVGKIISGTVSMVGNTYYMTLSLISVKTGEIENIAEDKCKCEVDELLDATKRLSKILLYGKIAQQQ
jgi:tetratricopeptide (TPR) repeat protein